MRSLVLVCLWCGIAAAQKVKFVDVLNDSSAIGDWAGYTGERRDGDKLVPHRVFVLIAPRTTERTKISWYHGDPGTEIVFHERKRETRPNVIEELAEVVTAITKNASDLAPKDVTLETSTCKVNNKDVPCTTVRFKLAGNDVAVGLTTEMRGLGIATFEITDPKKVVLWKIKATGAGRSGTSEWGVKRPDAFGGVTYSKSSKAPAPSVAIGEPATTGGQLDGAIIRRYVKRNAAKITYCYEKALLAKPTIQGIITITFEIGLEGKVTSSTATGVAPEVSDCVAQVLKLIEFPKPKDGKTVTVKYPITFKPTT